MIATGEWREQNGIVMIPAIPPPKQLRCRSIDFKLKPGWRFDEAKGVFIDRSGVEFATPRLPKNSRVLYKVPSLARSASKKLSGAERDLQRYMQVILPSPRSTKSLLQAVQSLPAVEEAHLAPEISLPIERSSERKSNR
jgi:hypothetical protein